MSNRAAAAPCCLLVDVPAEQHPALAGLATAGAVAGAGLESAVASCTLPVDVIVIGAQAQSPVDLVQRAHRAAPDAGVLVVPSGDAVEQVRRAIAYAPAVPLDVRVLDPGAPLETDIAELASVVQRRRRHRELVSAVSARAAAVPPGAPRKVVAIGALLEHAPLAVLVSRLDGRVVGWNRRAEALLSLASAVTDVPVDELLPGAGVLVRADLPTGPGAPSVGLTAAGGAEVEVDAVASQLDDGTPVVLLLAVDVTQRRAAEHARDRLAGHVALLSRVSEALTSTLDTAEALSALAEQLVPGMADWISLQLADGTGALGLVTMRHRDPELADLTEQASRRQAVAASAAAPSQRAARDNQALLLRSLSEQDLTAYVPDTTLRDLARRLGVGSVVAVPLPGRAGVLGSMALVNAPGSPPFTGDDLALATEIGRRAGIALDNARLYAQQRDVATELQRSLLTAPPQPERVQVVVRYVAAAQEAQVGGDWYDAFVQHDGATVLVIGDVVGHDLQAAAGMSQLRGVLRGIGYTTSAEPAEVLRRVDAAIEGLLIGTTATAVVGRLEQTLEDRAQGVTWLAWSNAGHPPPIVMSATGEVSVLDSDDADLLLGIDPTTPRTTARTALAAGATVLLYTDGLVERRGQDLDDGVARLVRVLEACRDCTVEELCDSVLKQMLPDEPEDDVALVAVRLADA